MINLRKLTPDDAAVYRELRLYGLQESPTAFGSSYEQEVANELAFFSARIANTANSWVLGAFADRELVGTIGFVRDQGVKTQHRGFIWGMYVHPAWRGRGLGRQLMVRAIEYVAEMKGVQWVRLSVTVGNNAAQQLYESLGFTVYGEEPEVLLVDNVFYGERHMTRRL